MSQDRHRQRNRLIRQALQATVERVDQAATPEDAFAPIGELVFWIVAADAVLERQQAYEDFRRHHQQGHLLFGIRYVRNKVAHESEAWEYGEEAVPMDQYFDNYRYTKWTWAQLPAPGAKDWQHWHKQFAAYKTHLPGAPVVDTAMHAVEVLEDWWKQQGI
jgi:hypothetical protein